MMTGNRSTDLEVREARLAHVVHELRNPLAGVRAAIQIVASRLPPSTEHELLRNALARLSDVDGMLASLCEESATSGVHALDIPAATGKKSVR